MHYFSGKGCSEFLESMHYCIGILTLILYLKKVLLLPERIMYEYGVLMGKRLII